MRKNILIIFGLLLTLTLYACSDDDTSSNNTGNDPNNNASNDGNNDNSNNENDGNEEQEEVTIKIGLPGGFALTSEEIIDGFKEEHPNINVELDEGPWGEFVQQIATRIAGETAPDLWFQENAVILGHGDRGVAEDLAPYIERYLNKDDYVDALFSGETPTGEVYGVPHGINPVALAYNKNIFEEAGVDFPTDDWTYEDLVETAKELTQETDDGKIYGMHVNGNMSQGWFPWIKANGGQILDESLTEANFTDPKTVEAIEIWSDMVLDYEVAPDSDYVDAAGGTRGMFGSDKMGLKFLQYSEQVAMAEDYPEVEYDTVMMPKGFNGNDRFVPMVVNSWVMFSKSDQKVKDAAWEFLKYYLGDEAQLILAESFASLPVKKDALDALDEMTDTQPSNKSAFTKGIAEAGGVLDDNPTWTEWNGAAQTIFSDIFDGIIQPEEGLEQINEAVQKVLDEG